MNPIAQRESHPYQTDWVFYVQQYNRIRTPCATEIAELSNNRKENPTMKPRGETDWTRLELYAKAKSLIHTGWSMLE